MKCFEKEVTSARKFLIQFAHLSPPTHFTPPYTIGLFGYLTNSLQYGLVILIE